MLTHTARNADSPVATVSPDLLLAALSVIGQPHRASERDLIEALALSLHDDSDRAGRTTPAPRSPSSRCRCCAPLVSVAG